MLTTRLCAIGTCLVFAGAAFAGPDWVEIGDAGSTLGSAQQTLGTGPLNSITGSLNGGLRVVGDFEDMYLIRVVDPVNFSMTLLGASFDAQLFVFNVTLANEAFGLLANDNTPSGNIPFVGPFANDGTGAALKNPGVYAIAISGAGRQPVSVNGLIFNFFSPTEISGPDGPGGINPHTGWSGEGQTGDYTITMTGVGFYNTPAPGSGAVFLGAALVAAARRRRR
jgi:hypothetical protein